MALYKDPDWLYEAHCEFMLTTHEMAEEVGCCQWTIRHWMNRLNIPLRTQSEAVRLRFEDITERETISKKVSELWKDETYRRRQSIGRVRGWKNEDRRKELSRRNSLQVGDKHPMWNGGKVECSCEVCDAKFEVSPYILERGYGRFCSRECYGIWKSGSILGQNNPNWRGGSSEYPEEFSREFRHNIRKRDGFVCAMCGASENSRLHDVHHINYRKEDTLPDNCITLCRKCHVVLQGNRDFWQEKLMLLRVGVRRVSVV